MNLYVASRSRASGHEEYAKKNWKEVVRVNM